MRRDADAVADAVPEATGTPTSSQAVLTIPEAVEMICAPPAYSECTADMETFFEGWTVANLSGQTFGVCDLGSGTGDVVWIDTGDEAERECGAAQEYRNPNGPVEVVRVITTP